VDAPGQAFVDFHNDVTVADIELAARENFVSVEHLKRYTTLGMAPDQGRTANVNAIAQLGTLTGRAPGAVGTVRARFPYTPVPFAAFAGRARGALFRPMRSLPAHDAHVALRAEFEEFAGWWRPLCYPRAGERAAEAVRREALAVRSAAGLFDGSPLGKIEVAGPDAAGFLDRICANAMATLAVGRIRYGLLLNELGVIIDDGVVARLAPDRFLLQTTSAGAERTLAWLEAWLQGDWPELEVLVAPVTASWAVLTVTGPLARAVLAGAGVDFALDSAAFPHMSLREGVVAGVPARVARVSFTGELSFEVSVAATEARTLWDRLLAAGARHGLEPVGVDAWMVLRTEKGYLHVGGDTDGTTTPLDVGWERVLDRSQDFVGKRALLRPANQRADRLQFVGYEPQGTLALAPGLHVRGLARTEGSDGYVTAAVYSPVLDRWVALGMLRGGRARLGERVQVLNGAGHAHARVVAPGAYDPAGARLRG
jgi:sarcosine oxidase subunit alpha